MSHRKYERPRHGSLGFLPRKRCRHQRGRIRTFPTDDATQKPHLTAFFSYKAGMTHIVRDLDRPGSKMHKKEIVEAVTVLVTPPIVIVGLCGYIKTPRGLRCLCTVWAQHLPDQFKRALYKNWHVSKKKAFGKYSKKLQNTTQWYDKSITDMKKYCSVIRVIACSQVHKLRIGQKKSHIMEIQINGGSVAEKVEFGLGLFEAQVRVTDVFKESEMVDCVGVTKGHGFEGVVARWGVTRLPRKTHKGLRKVACIGAWHPARVCWSVPRPGQCGYHHRTIINKKIYRIGKNVEEDKTNAKCEYDLTDKTITPMGGFQHFGIVKEDFLLVKGMIQGPQRRVITLRKQLHPNPSRASQEKIALKFIDTSSKFGHGKFQSSKERNNFMGIRKNKAAAQ